MRSQLGQAKTPPLNISNTRLQRITLPADGLLRHMVAVLRSDGSTQNIARSSTAFRPSPHSGYSILPTAHSRPSQSMPWKQRSSPERRDGSVRSEQGRRGRDRAHADSAFTENALAASSVCGTLKPILAPEEALQRASTLDSDRIGLKAYGVAVESSSFVCLLFGVREWSRS